MIEVISITLVIIGALIGAGFASGQEIFSFFYIYGKNGIYGILIMSILIGIFIYKSLKIIYQKQVYNYNDFLNLRTTIGVKVIENFWLNYIFHFGIIVVIMFVIAYFFVIKSVFKTYKLSTKLILVLGILIIMSSTNGLYSDYRSFLVLLLCGYAFAPQKNMNEKLDSKYSEK